MLLEEDDASSPPSSIDTAAPRRRPRLGAIALVVLLALPMLVAAVSMAEPTWYAHDDYALTEMRVRDVTSTSPPLVGLGGRIHHDGVAGSHPGPLSFYLLAPIYRLLGSSSWALQVSTAALGLAAVGLALWIGRRRAGLAGLLAAATGTVTLLVAYGPERWMLPWNPSLPLLWWPVVLLAAWSVLCRDRPMVLVFVGAASFCAQTHISYVGMVAGLGVLLALSMGWAAWAGRSGDRDPPPRRGRPLTWLVAGAALLVVLWLPPIVDQIAHDPGNASVIAGQFLDSDAASAGWATAADVVLARLDPGALLTGDDDRADASAGGIAVVAVWVIAAAVSVAWRRRLPPDLPRLHAVVAVAGVLGFVSVSRVQGTVYPYLTLWSWGTAVVMAAATIWTGVAVVRARWAGAGERLPDRWARPAGVVGRAALIGALAVGLVVAGVDAARPDPLERGGRVRSHAAVFPAAFDALADGRVDGFGPDDRYLVRAVDGYTAGMSSFTVLNEMERRGFDVGIGEVFDAAAGRERIVDPEDATAVLTYAAGAAIDDMRADPDAVELAAVDLPPEAGEAADAARDEAVAALERAGRPDLAARVDDGVFALLLDEEALPDDAAAALQEMMRLGAPVAIFVSPAPGG